MNGKLAAIVDDEPLMRELIKQVVLGAGYTTATYSSPLECPCLKNCSEGICFDVLITDLSMPGMDGIKFIRQLRKRNCKVGKIAIISGHLENSVKATAEQLDCQTFLKPFYPDDLVKWLERE